MRTSGPLARVRGAVAGHPGWSAAAFVVVAAVAVGLVTWLWPSPSGPVASVRPTATAEPPTPATRSAPEPGSTTEDVPRRDGMWLTVDAVGIDVRVDPIGIPSDGVLDPPELDTAAWIEAYGAPTPESDNTAYIAGHSWNRGDAVFNALFDQEAQTPNVSEGDEVVVAVDGEPVRYTVTGTERYPKGDLADTDEVWRKDPGRLVLITCFQRNDGGRSQDNLVVFADLADAD